MSQSNVRFDDFDSHVTPEEYYDDPDRELNEWLDADTTPLGDNEPSDIDDDYGRNPYDGTSEDWGLDMMDDNPVEGFDW
jgi:hypothetical protein